MVRNILSYSGLALFLAFVAQPAFSTPANPERVYGWIEEGILLPENIAVKVKVRYRGSYILDGCERLRTIP